MNWKKLASLGVVAMMSLSILGCGSDSASDKSGGDSASISGSVTGSGSSAAVSITSGGARTSSIGLSSVLADGPEVRALISIALLLSAEKTLSPVIQEVKVNRIAIANAKIALLIAYIKQYYIEIVTRSSNIGKQKPLAFQRQPPCSLLLLREIRIC